MKDDKTITKVRRVVKSSNALEVVLPVDFIRKTGLAKGDEVVIAYTDQVLTVVPNPNRMMEITKGEVKPNGMAN